MTNLIWTLATNIVVSVSTNSGDGLKTCIRCGTRQPLVVAERIETVTSQEVVFAEGRTNGVAVERITVQSRDLGRARRKQTPRYNQWTPMEAVVEPVVEAPVEPVVEP